VLFQKVVSTDTYKEAFLAQYQEATPLDAQLEQMPMLRPPMTQLESPGDFWRELGRPPKGKMD
jgi:hypothetical protein